jgi:hypothetical protein
LDLRALEFLLLPAPVGVRTDTCRPAGRCECITSPPPPTRHLLPWQPFVDADHPLQAWFPERRWAIAIPTVLFITVVAVAGTFVGLVMAKSGKKKA